MPTMKSCAKGHYYDGDRFSSCPYCQGAGGGGTVPKATFPIGGTAPAPGAAMRKGLQDMDKTVGMSEQQNGIDPVAGWLVCVEGPDKGRDFRLHFGNNSVGRHSERDVCIPGDASISRKHFSVSYDQRNKSYFVSMGEGKEIVYVNDAPLGGGTLFLKEGDKIRVAHTTLVFVPFAYF